MKKELLILTLFLFSFTFVLAENVQVDYYYGLTCPHCKAVADSGVLERADAIEGVTVTKHEVWYDQKNQPLFDSAAAAFSIPKSQRGVPFLVINYSGKYTYLTGDTPIIQSLESYVTTGDFPEQKYDSSIVSSDTGSSGSSTLWIWGLILAIIIFFSWLAFRKK